MIPLVFPGRCSDAVAQRAAAVAALCARGETLLAGEPPGAALFAWLREFIAHVAAKRDLALAIPTDPAGERSALFDGWHQAMRATTARLLARAQSAGAAGAGLDAADLLTLASGIAATAADPGQAERCLALVRDGISPATGRGELSGARARWPGRRPGTPA